MKPGQKRRLEAQVLALLRTPMSLEELHDKLAPFHPGLRKATLFALLVRLRREGKVVYREGRFLAGAVEEENV
ncbi:hypothetical protein GCM10007092_01880 [Thermus composti]|uniref:Uncharacterized protein n=1 Tax=Thermus composti TaxID=532059 RepID=A0ABV6PY57_9DEIN|nr:hypothetical protein [Thermus composti]GGM92455.1 hypothetical protein GCM10007092_01880 [Thermus composti]